MSKEFITCRAQIPTGTKLTPLWVIGPKFRVSAPGYWVLVSGGLTIASLPLSTIRGRWEATIHSVGPPAEWPQ
jgi:hypothetical protein